MKKHEILSVDKFISTLALNNFDKETRSALVYDHLMLYKYAEEVERDINELRRTLVAGHEDKVALLAELREKNDIERINAECQDLLEIEAELNHQVNEILNDVVPVVLKKVDLDEFLSGLIKCGLSLTPSDLVVFQSLFA